MQWHPARFDLGEVENVVDQRQQVLCGPLDPAESLLLPRRKVAVNPVQHERRIADERVDWRPQLVRHAGEEFRFEPIRLLQLARLPLEPGVLFGEIGRCRLNSLLELARERLELLVETLIFRLLGEVVEHGDDRERLAPTIEDFSGDDFDRKLNARLRNVELHLLAPGQGWTDGEIGY